MSEFQAIHLLVTVHSVRFCRGYCGSGGRGRGVRGRVLQLVLRDGGRAVILVEDRCPGG